MPCFEQRAGYDRRRQRLSRFLILKTGRTVSSLLASGEDFEHWIARESRVALSDFDTLEVFSNEFPASLKAYAGVIITGSPAFVTDREDWSVVTESLVSAALEQEIPTLGICYGHQLLAQCRGGVVDFHPDGREIGSVEISLTNAARNDALFSAMPETFVAQVSHLQSVARLPGDAVLLAGNDFEPNHAFRIGSCAWGIQFHPEFSADVVAAYIRERRREIKNEGLCAEELLQQVRDTPQASKILPRFIEIAIAGVS